VISYRELVVLLNGADRLDQIEAVQHLIERGLSEFKIKDGAIIGLENTDAGNSRLCAMMLPRASE
jgi:hypothetical protein